jgi:hypothetical protein
MSTWSITGSVSAMTPSVTKLPEGTVQDEYSERYQKYALNSFLLEM